MTRLRELRIRSGAAFAGVLAIIVGCSPCSDEIKQRLPSPDRRSVAIVLERNCGATTDWVTNVLVQPESKADRPDLDRAVLVIEGQPDLVLTWRSPRELDVKWTGGRSVFRELSSMGDVRVTYDEPIAHP